MRLRIVRRAAGGPHAYEGMDRPAIGAGVPETLVVRAVALEELTPVEAEAAYRTLSADLAAAGHDHYELLALGSAPSAAWELLGYDVGEDTPTAWSALAHREQFLDEEERAANDRRLNEHGLFSDRSDAEAFLEYYLATGDPDRGWTSNGWTNEPDIYAVVPVHRFVGVLH